MNKKNLTIKETFALAFHNHQQNNFQVAKKQFQFAKKYVEKYFL